jgi:hypothetical protein
MCTVKYTHTYALGTGFKLILDKDHVTFVHFR